MGVQFLPAFGSHPLSRVPTGLALSSIQRDKCYNGNVSPFEKQERAEESNESQGNSCGRIIR